MQLANKMLFIRLNMSAAQVLIKTKVDWGLRSDLNDHLWLEVTVKNSIEVNPIRTLRIARRLRE